MQTDKGVNLQRAILLLEELPQSPRIDQAMSLILVELDELKKESPTPEEVLGAAKGEVEEVRQAKEGSYVLQKVKCGDPSCHCMKKPEDFHGPYWYLFTKKNGKTRSKYIGKNLPARAAT